jgi:hypothetical protein
MAIDYVLHVELGGVAGVVAPLIGKQPGDYHIWILRGATPAFIREEGALYEGGPTWRIEQTSPVFPPKWRSRSEGPEPLVFESRGNALAPTSTRDAGPQLLTTGRE